MKAEVIQAFVGAAREVLSQEMGEAVEPQRPRLQGGPYRALDITVIVGLAQGVEGAVLLGIAKSTALQYISYVMGDADELDELALSGIAELGNMIAGKAGVRMAELGYEPVIAPPTLIVGTDAMLTTLNVPRLVVPVQTPFGLVDLQLAAQLRG